MPEEKPAPETPATEPRPEGSRKPAEQKKVKVILKVAMSEVDVGKAAKVGDEVEVDADVAERWIAAGIAEAAGSAASAKAPNASADAPPTTPPSSRRSGTG